MVWNEAWFLPHFLEHHRKLGVDYFIFYDDCSTDRTREILLGEADCAVVAPEAEPGETLRHGVWLQRQLSNHIAEGEGAGRWALTLDADEFLLLPTAFSNIDDVVAYLERRSLAAALAAMVDFYPERLADRFYDPLAPLSACRWFDRDPGFVRVPGRPSPKISAAGVRARLLAALNQHHPQKIAAIYGDMQYRLAKLWKVPLVKTGVGIVRSGPHNINIEPPAGIQLALAHFKFYPGLDDRVRLALSREGHFNGGVEYRFLRAVLDLFPDESLICSRSVEYRSPEDVERAVLMWAE